MARPRTWKDIPVKRSGDLHALRAYWLSNRGAWAEYTVEFDFGWGAIITDMPWDELRRWFSFADVRMSKDILTSNEHPFPD